MMGFSKTKRISLLLLIIVSFSCSSAFIIHKKFLIATTCKLKRNTFVRLAANNDDTKSNGVTTIIDETDSLSESGNNFDANGFASYLGPYLLAFIASIAVTAGFFKYVLLDN